MKSMINIREIVGKFFFFIYELGVMEVFVRWEYNYNFDILFKFIFFLVKGCL